MSDADDAGTGSATDVVDEALRQQFEWYIVAKKEFKDTVRSKGLWVLSFVFTVLFVVPAAATVYGILGVPPAAQQAEVGTKALISLLYLDIVTVLLPLVAMFVGYAALTKERESGSLKVLLSLPFSRRDVIVGKVVGRCAVVTVTLAIAFVLTAVFLFAAEITFNEGAYLLFALFTGGLALVIVAIAVSISGAVATNRQSMVANFFVYFYITFAWNSMANGFGRVLGNRAGVGGALRWHLTMVVKLLNPSQSYKTLINSLLREGENAQRLARLQMFSRDSQTEPLCADVLYGNFTTVEIPVGNQTFNQTACQHGGNPVPVFYSDPAIFVYLLLWIGVAAAVSYYTFNRGDI